MTKLKLGAKLVSAPAPNIAQETKATTLESSNFVSSIKIQELTGQSQAIHSQLSDLTARLEHERNELAKIAVRKELAEGKVISTAQELQAKQATLSEITADVAIKQQELEVAQAQYNQAKQALDAATEPAQQTSAQLAQVNQKIAETDAKSQEIQNQIEKLNEINKVIDEELQALSVNNSDGSPKVGWPWSWFQARQDAAKKNSLDTKYDTNQVLLTQLAEQQKVLNEEYADLTVQKENLSENLKDLRRTLEAQGKLFEQPDKALSLAQQAYDSASANQDEASNMLNQTKQANDLAQQELQTLVQTYNATQGKIQTFTDNTVLYTAKIDEINQEIEKLQVPDLHPPIPEEEAHLELENKVSTSPPQTRLHRSSSLLPPTNLTSITTPLSESSQALTFHNDPWSARSSEIIEISHHEYEARITDESIVIDDFNAEELAALDLMDYMINLKRDPGQMIAITEGSDRAKQLMLMRAAAHGLTKNDITIENKSPEEIEVLLNQYKSTPDELMQRVISDTYARKNSLQAQEPTTENTTGSFSPRS